MKESIESCETIAECMDVFDTQQSYDVADMVKQYLRDLPDSLLTMKMSETFLAIFQRKYHLKLLVLIGYLNCLCRCSIGNAVGCNPLCNTSTAG